VDRDCRHQAAIADPVIKILNCGDAAFTVELGSVVDPAVNARVHLLDAAIANARLPGLIETVPTYRSILVSFDPMLATQATLAAAITAINDQLPQATARAAPAWLLPVVFGGDHGEDLDEVARRTNLTTAEVIRLHCAADYRVYMIGFSPGYSYLGGLTEKLHLPRRDSPRLMTPASTFMQGGAQAGFSPFAIPSGWHLLGQTPLRLFDQRRADPFLLKPGDRVRVVQISPAEYQRLSIIAAQGDLLPERET